MRPLLLTGPPGCGKTTVLRRVAAALAGEKVRGLLTDEMREAGARVGFRIEALGGETATFAHVDFRTRARVGRYGVDLAALERVVESELRPDPRAFLYLVDEIGKMECLSPRFVAAVEALLDARSPLVATVALKGGGLIARVKARPDAEVWEVTRASRDALPARVLERLGAGR